MMTDDYQDLSAITAVLDSGASQISQAVANAINAKVAKENVQYQYATNALNESLTREAWARDDNAVQRRVADLKAAGLSPLLAAGSAAGNSAAATMVAPHSEFKYNPTNYDMASALAFVQQYKQNELAIQGQKIANENARKEGELRQLDIDNYGLPWQAQIANRLIEALTGNSLFDIAANFNLGGITNLVGDAIERFTGAGDSAKSTEISASSDYADRAVDGGYAHYNQDGTISFNSGINWQHFFVKVLGGTTNEWYTGLRKFNDPERFVRYVMENGLY